MSSSASSSRARSALLFMQHCRRARQGRNPSSLSRQASQSQFPSQLRVQAAHSSSSSPYDPSNFAKPLRRPRDLPPAPNYHYPRAQTPSATEVRIPGLRPSLWTTIKSAFGWKPPFPDYVPAPFTGANNPYKARKPWPPDFRNLHPMQQFHFEKTYRRRAKLAYTRPRWNRRVKLVQHTLVLTALIYFIFFAEPKDMGTPFDGFRVWFFGKLKDLGTMPDATREELVKLEQEARETKDQRAFKGWGLLPSSDQAESSSAK